MTRSSAPALLALLLVPHLAAAATPVCVEQAVNEFENGGPCNLGDSDCLCSSANQGKLLSDISEACVNDSSVMNNPQSYVQSVCSSMTGGTSSAAGGYPTSSPPPPKGVSTSYPTSAPPAPASSSPTAYPTMPGGVLPPTGNATTLAPGGGSSYPVSAPATTAPAGATTYPVSGGGGVATVTSFASVSGPATAVPPAPTSAVAAGGAAGSLGAKLGLGLGAGAWGALLVAGLL